MGMKLTNRYAWVLLVLLAVGCGCHSTETVEKESDVSAHSQMVDAYNSWKGFTATNPCGTLKVTKPLFNVTGRITAPVRPGSRINLFIAKDTTYESAAYTVRNCRALTMGNVDHNDRFTLPAIPKGTYVLMLPGRAFRSGQGFPLLNQMNDSSCHLHQFFHGGDREYSMALFQIC